MEELLNFMLAPLVDFKRHSPIKRVKPDFSEDVLQVLVQ